MEVRGGIQNKNRFKIILIASERFCGNNAIMLTLFFVHYTVSQMYAIHKKKFLVFR